jgi:hypothetical protein
MAAKAEKLKILVWLSRVKLLAVFLGDMFFCQKPHVVKLWF